MITDQEIKEFWKGCGLEFYESDNRFWARTPSGGAVELLIDLNNLRRYAFPKLKRPLITMHLKEDVWLVAIYHAKEEGKPYQIGTSEDKRRRATKAPTICQLQCAYG